MALRDVRRFTGLVVKDMAAMLRRARGSVHCLRSAMIAALYQDRCRTVQRYCNVVFVGILDSMQTELPIVRSPLQTFASRKALLTSSDM